MAATRTAGATAAQPLPLRHITVDDLRASLRDGYEDFMDKRGDLIFIGILYPIIGLVAALVTLKGNTAQVLFPIAAGLSLVGPLVSTGFYELARRRESGLESNWWHFLDVRKNESLDQIIFVGALLIAIFVAWVASAALIYNAFFGDRSPSSVGDLLAMLFTTGEGWAMMIVGNLVGLLFAIVVLAVSVISLPMLIDRDIDAGTAVAASVRCVRENPGVMMRWGLIVAALLFVGSLPVFLGLAVVLPVLGYATWHLYTRVVDRSALPVAAGDQR